MQITKSIAGYRYIPAVLLLILIPMVVTAQQNAGQDNVNAINTVNIAGTQITMAMPGVFVYNESQSAYIYSGAASSIAVKELDGSPYSSVIKGITKDYLEKQGMNLLESSELVTKSGMKGMMYLAEFKVKGREQDKPVDYMRIIYLTGNQNRTAWITMNFPVITRSLIEDVLKQCLYTVELD